MSGADLTALSGLLRTAQETEHGHSVKPAAAAPASHFMSPADLARAGDVAASAGEAEPEAKKELDPKAIWDADAVPEMEEADDEGETRPRPEFDIVLKQAVGTEDVYLGLSDVDVSTTHCNAMVVKVMLPGEKLANVDLDVTKQKIRVSANNFYLSTYLPYPVRHKDGKAKWIRDKEILQVTLPIIRAEW